jgi:integrase
MRRGELLSILWCDVDLASATLHIRRTKNGHPRTIPLTSNAVAVLRNLPKRDDRVFPVNGNAARLAWERLRERAGVSDLRFHDLRHEAVSRFFELGLNVPEVAMISGHRDPRMLFRYTHPKPELVAQKLP